MMDGGKDVDNNAMLFAKGAHSVLDPLQSAGKLKIASGGDGQGLGRQPGGPDLHPGAHRATAARSTACSPPTTTSPTRSIGVLKGNGLAGHVAITGQDAGVEGLQNIINGAAEHDDLQERQASRPTRRLQLAIALIGGKDPAAAGLTLTKFDDPKAPSHNIQALLLPAAGHHPGQRRRTSSRPAR